MHESFPLSSRIVAATVSLALLMGAGNAQAQTGGTPADIDPAAPAFDPVSSESPAEPALAVPGTTAEPQPTPPAPISNPPTPNTKTPSGLHHATCPLPNVLTPKDVSSNTSCGRFLVRQLYGSVYKDPDKKLAIAAYESQTGAKKVDGVMDVNTAISIMRGKAIDNIFSPDPKATEKELFFDKRKQLAYLLGVNASGKSVVRTILKGSSGLERSYTEGGGGFADTPNGNFRVYNIGGKVVQVPLGVMYWPHMIEKRQGIAIHGGDVNTNTLGLSHGCIHLSMPAMPKYVNKFLTMGTRVKVRGKTRTTA